MNKFHTALLPFAAYYRRLTDGRRNYPRTGVVHGFDEGCPTETIITVEDLKLANDLTQAVPAWSPRVQAAYAFAKDRHAGQFRRDGVTPYIAHIDEVMARAGDDEINLIVAALHDLVEDKRATIEEITFFWGPAIADGVLTLTRRLDETYESFIARIATSHKGRWACVKIADILANLSYSPTPSQIRRYAKALIILST